MKTIIAWHFFGDTLRDGTPVPKDGVWLKYKGELKICQSGFHASKEPFDALEYAPGPNLAMVKCCGIGEEHNDKFVCSERMIVKRMDATEMLRYFARMQALSVIDLYPNGTDDVVFDYLMTGDEALRHAAWYAASAVARAAAWAAASAAASAVARAAALDAALDAAWDAAWAATWYARDARAARAAAKTAAWAATWDARAATWDARAARAARAAARKDFNELVYECFGVKK